MFSEYICVNVFSECRYVNEFRECRWSMYLVSVDALIHLVRRGGGLGSRPKNMYGETLGDGVEYHLMKPTPRR